jgi:hypothetical protein
MENENRRNNIQIPKSVLKYFVIGLLFLTFIFLLYTYLSQGLTHKKSKEVFEKNWKNENKGKLEEVEILGMRKIKNDSYLVKIKYTYIQDQNQVGIDYTELGKPTTYEYPKTQKETDEENRRTVEGEYLFTKWDTGWFVEEK